MQQVRKEAIRIIKKNEKKNPDMPSVCFPICILDVQYSVTLLTGEVGVKWVFMVKKLEKE